MRLDVNDLAKQVRCPYCGAERWSRCINPAARRRFPGNFVHRERVEAAQIRALPALPEERIDDT